jgi:anti-sigma28 factor (negative regulator of flagellin synthesis)
MKQVGESGMNVSNGIENLTQIFPAQSAPPATASKSNNPLPSEALADDKARLSTVATRVAQSAAASDARLDKVAGIQSALQAGIYDVSGADVAQKVIASILAPER